MKKIVPYLWFDKEDEIMEATKLYVSLFPNSEIENVNKITGTPSGDCNIVNFKLGGEEFMAINAGPYFKFNPAVSFFVVFEDEKEIEKVWNKLIDGGKALMPFDTYPWAKKYGWLNDKYGVSWQLSMSDDYEKEQKIRPFFMFTKDKAGKAKEAIEKYVKIFPNSKIDTLVPYEKGDGDKEGFIKHGRFILNDQHFIGMDSSLPHDFTFDGAISFKLSCDTQEEIDYYWNNLSAVPEAEQCGWLKDKYGISWQVVPSILGELMGSEDEEKSSRVTQAFLKMKKFDIEALKKAYEGR